MEYIFPIIVLLLLIFYGLFLRKLVNRARRNFSIRRRIQRKARKDRYAEYLKSDEWQRKRYVVFKRDNWKCQYCGAKATEVHHLKYAKYQIGKEPIKWLVSVCSPCHRKQH